MVCMTCCVVCGPWLYDWATLGGGVTEEADEPMSSSVEAAGSVDTRSTGSDRLLRLLLLTG